MRDGERPRANLSLQDPVLSQLPSSCPPYPPLLPGWGRGGLLSLSSRVRDAQKEVSPPTLCQCCQACPSLPPSRPPAPSSFPGPHPALSNLLPLQPQSWSRMPWPGGNLGPSSYPGCLRVLRSLGPAQTSGGKHAPQRGSRPPLPSGLGLGLAP